MVRVWVTYCCITNHPSWLKAAGVLLFLRILWFGWGSIGWFFQWSHLESPIQLHSDGSHGWTSEVASLLMCLASQRSPCGFFLSRVARYSHAELRVSRGRNQKLPVFLRSGIRSLRMFLVPYSLGQSQGQGQSLFKGKRKTSSLDVRSSANTPEGRLVSSLCKLPNYNLYPLPFSSTFSFSSCTLENFELFLFPLLNTWLLSVIKFFSQFLFNWLDCFLLLTDFFFLAQDQYIHWLSELFE